MSPVSVSSQNAEVTPCAINVYSSLREVLRARQNAPVELHQTTSIPNPRQFLPSLATDDIRKNSIVPKCTLKQQNCNINFGIQLIRTQVSKLFEKIENSATWFLNTWLTQGAI